MLQFALILERLEDAFYREALADRGRVPPIPRRVFETISAHEMEHVRFLEETLGTKAGPAPEFDFTGRRLRSERVQDLLAPLVGLRGHRPAGLPRKAGELAGSPEILTSALTIPSVEARHAAGVRRLRELQGWILDDQPDAPGRVAAVYAGMDETMKYDVDVPGCRASELSR